ncbi:MAG: hypothetical protein WCL50_18920, partial [Spirochaetota bacterium]
MIPSLLLGALALALLLILLLRGKEGRDGRETGDGRRSRGAAKPPDLSGAQTPRPGTCTICSSVLAPGERVKSDIFPGTNPRIMRIFGCIHCLGP